MIAFLKKKIKPINFNDFLINLVGDRYVIQVGLLGVKLSEIFSRYLEAVTEKSKVLYALFSLRTLMQRPENSNLFCCFLAWRLADYISQRSYKGP